MHLLFFAIGLLILACIFWAIVAPRKPHKCWYSSEQGIVGWGDGTYWLRCGCGRWKVYGK